MGRLRLIILLLNCVAVDEHGGALESIDDGLIILIEIDQGIIPGVT
jgi:hypothetical protein